MTNDKYIEQAVVNTCARSDLHTATRLAPIPDDRHRAAASDFAIRQDEPSMILMRIHRQNCTHHGVRGRAKQAFEFNSGDESSSVSWKAHLARSEEHTS